MKKLSLQNNIDATLFSVKTDDIEAIIYNDGFSGYEINGLVVRGSCCICAERTCATYSEREMYSKRFAEFPKNPTKRVCPTDSISFDQEGFPIIDNDSCIKCGLCLHRCPYAAIQLSIKDNTCIVNTEKNSSFVKCTPSTQKKDIVVLRTKPKSILFPEIKREFTVKLTHNLEVQTNRYPDLSEIMVRNTFLNLGYCCNTNAAGNNHNRTEFFAEIDDMIVIGESQISNTDTLSVTRRILDDLAVLISRHNFDRDKIIPLAVVNGFPNRRTDFYEVIEDIFNVLHIQVVTLTYHTLFVLNLYQPRLSTKQLKSFVINRKKDSLFQPMQQIIPSIKRTDQNIDTINYSPIK